MVEDASHPLVRDTPGGLCWRRSDRRRYGRAAEAHRELVVLLGLSGRAQYLIDGEVVPLRRGTLLFAFAGQAHVLLSDSRDFDMWVFLISDRVLDPSRRAEPTFSPLNVTDRGPLPARRLGEAALAELGRVADTARQTEGLVRLDALRYWLTRAWAHWSDAADLTSASVHPAVDRAAHVIRQSPELDLATVARAAGLSPGRLSKLFRVQTGQGFAAFRTECRLTRVEEMCRGNPRLSLTTAALDAGFGSYSQFFREFVRRNGQSPRVVLSKGW